MIFSDLRVRKIFYTIRYVPTLLRFGAANRPTYIIGIQCHGKAEHFFRDRSFTLEENCIYFFNKDEGYDVEILEKGMAFSVHFDTYEPIALKSFCIKIKDAAPILRILERIEYQMQRDNTTNIRALADLYALFVLFEEIYDRKYHPDTPEIQLAREYLNLHFKEKDCLAKAAELCGVTQRRFNDIFRETFHITPNCYIVNLKLSLAKQLLDTQQFTVTGVAELCGFNNVYYFSKLFKDKTGETPSSYRQRKNPRSP